MKKIGLHFFIFSLIVIFWSLSFYFYSNSPKTANWPKVIVFFSIFLIFELFLFIVALSNKSPKDSKKFLITFFSLWIIILSFLFIKSNASLFPPPVFYFFLLIFIYLAWIFLFFFERILKTSGIENLQSIAVLLIFGFFLVAMTILNVFIPFITGEIKYNWLNLIFPFFLIVFSAFFLFRFSFIATKNVFMELLIGITGLILLILPFLIKDFNLKILSFFALFLFCIFAGYFNKTLSEEVKRRAEIEKLLAEWEKLARTKDQFILSLQHHLRTPLFPIKGHLEMILSGAYGTVENPIIREKIVEIKNLVNNLYLLIERLLEIQELRVDKKILNIEDCQINDLIDGVVEELKPEAEAKGLYLKFEKSPLPIVKLDIKKIREVIWNLVDNAIKYTTRGGVTIKAEIENDKLKVAVSDTGIGMEKEDVDYFLAGKFFERGENAKKLYGPGRGIGLAIAIEFVKAHNGKISAKSDGKNKGTTFWIEIPLK